MNSYVVLLKGINVGGHHKIKMADLRQHLQNTNKLSHIQTYIQSGNIILWSTLGKSEVETTVKSCIEQHYGFQIQTIAFTKDQWLEYSETHPYLNQAEDIKTLHLTFLFKVPEQEALQGLFTFKPENEHCEVIGATMFLFYPDGFGRCKFTSALIERKLKCNTTSRNWRTVQKLRSMVLDSTLN